MEYVLIFSTPGAPRLAIFETWVYPTDDTFLVTTQIPPGESAHHLRPANVHYIAITKREARLASKAQDATLGTLDALKLVRRGFPPEETRLRENQASLNVD
jgi:hypothetical protein